MNLGKIIDQNLFKEALDDAGREMTSIQSRQRYTTICGVCQSDIRRLKKLRCRVFYGRSCSLLNDDPGFNKGHSKQFFDAIDRAIARGDFK